MWDVPELKLFRSITERTFCINSLCGITNFLRCSCDCLFRNLSSLTLLGWCQVSRPSFKFQKSWFLSIQQTFIWIEHLWKNKTKYVRILLLLFWDISYCSLFFNSKGWQSYLSHICYIQGSWGGQILDQGHAKSYPDTRLTFQVRKVMVVGMGQWGCGLVLRILEYQYNCLFFDVFETLDLDLGLRTWT